MSSGRIGLPDVYRDEDDPRFFAPHGNCLICKRPLDIESDPDSANCGGDCRGCMREIEDDDFNDDGTYRRPPVSFPPPDQEMRVSAFYAEAEPIMEDFETMQAAACTDAFGCECGREHEDPNADLIGWEFAGHRVLGSTTWSPTYVRVLQPNGSESARAAKQVRHARLLAQGSSSTMSSTNDEGGST